jgi:ADP-heptose:LPS heptosyltransferase
MPRFPSPRDPPVWHWTPDPGALPLALEREAEVSFLVHQARFHVGDTLWLTPLLRAIHRLFPRARTTVVAPPVARELLAGNPHVAEIVSYAPAKGAGETAAARRRVLDSLNGRRFDAALFAFARRPESRWLARAAAAAGVLHRINLEYFDPALDSRRIPRWLTCEGWFVWGAMPSPRMLLHALDPFLEPERRGAWIEEDRRVELHLAAEDRRRAEEALADRGIGDEPFAVLAPGGLSSRRWPAARFARLAARLAAELGLHVLVEGSAAEEPLLAKVVARAAVEPGGRRILAAADPLRIFAALLERARLLVANDSAPIHLAEAAGAPTLYFAQREKLVHSHPAAPRCRALCDEVENDLRRITVEQALGAAKVLVSPGETGMDSPRVL